MSIDSNITVTYANGDSEIVPNLRAVTKPIISMTWMVATDKEESCEKSSDPLSDAQIIYNSSRWEFPEKLLDPGSYMEPYEYNQ